MGDAEVLAAAQTAVAETTALLDEMARTYGLPSALPSAPNPPLVLERDGGGPGLTDYSQGGDLVRSLTHLGDCAAQEVGAGVALLNRHWGHLGHDGNEDGSEGSGDRLSWLCPRTLRHSF